MRCHNRQHLWEFPIDIEEQMPWPVYDSLDYVMRKCKLQSPTGQRPCEQAVPGQHGIPGRYRFDAPVYDAKHEQRLVSLCLYFILRYGTSYTRDTDVVKLEKSHFCQKSIFFAGLPKTVVPAFTLLITTLPIPTFAPSPIFFEGATSTPQPI